MSKTVKQSDKPYAFIDKAGKGEAPVTFTQLVKLVHAGLLDGDDRIKRHSDKEWKRVADADWLMYLPAPESEQALTTSTTSHAEAFDNEQQKRGRTDVSRNLWRVYNLAIYTVIWAFFFIIIYFGGGPRYSNAGPLTGFPILLEMLAFLTVVGIGYAAIVYFGSSGYAEQSQARTYLEKELGGWKSRRSNQICSVVPTDQNKRVALENYIIVSIKKSVFVYDAHDITVDLHLVYPINSRVTTSHTFSVKWNSRRSKWEIVPETNFKP